MDTNRDGILTNEQYQAEAAKTRRLAAEDVEIANSVEGLEHRIDVLESLAEWDRTPGLLDSLKARLKTAKAARQAQYLASQNATAARLLTEGWTEEVTRSRRAAWNAEVAKLPKVGTAKAVAALKARIGFSVEDLKSAVALHNLTGR